MQRHRWFYVYSATYFCILLVSTEIYEKMHFTLRKMCVYVQEKGYYLQILWLLVVHWLEDDDKKLVIF